MSNADYDKLNEQHLEVRLEAARRLILLSESLDQATQKLEVAEIVALLTSSPVEIW